MKSTIALAIGIAFLSFQSAQATLLFSDNFDSYTSGTTLNGDVNPGNSTAWSGTSPGLTVENGSLTYGSLYTASSGNMFVISNGAAASATTLVNTYANQTSGTVYYSFLFDPIRADAGNTYFTALNPGTTAPNGGSDVVDAYAYSNGKMYLRANPDSATAGSGAVLTIGTTYLIVEEIDLTGHTANLWVNPDSSTFGTLTPPTATATLSALTAGEAVDDLGFKMQVTSGGVFNLDDLVVGTTWADVTSVPEPSMFALAGLGLTGLVLRLRRRN